MLTRYQRQQPWCSYALHLSTFNPPALIFDAFILVLVYNAATSLLPQYVPVVISLHLLFLVFTKVVKLIPHFYRYPSDLRYLPAHFLFGYVHGFIKVYALLTIWQTRWERRDEPNHLEEKGSLLVETPKESSTQERERDSMSTEHV